MSNPVFDEKVVLVVPVVAVTAVRDAVQSFPRLMTTTSRLELVPGLPVPFQVKVVAVILDW